MAPPEIDLTQEAEENGLAQMIADLIRQNLEAKPHKKSDFEKLFGSVALVAEDAGVALTLVFRRGRLTIWDGIFQVPDVTVRGPSDALLSLSNMPLTTRWALPLAGRGDKAGREISNRFFQQLFRREFHVYGMLTHLPLLLRLTRIMSVNG